MTNEIKIENKEVFGKIRVMSNMFRFRILELTRDKEINITELGEQLKLAYNKCADYVRMLEENGLVIKRKEGKNVLVRSKVKIEGKGIVFS
jgi:predicted transcriptional regulator